MKKKFLFLSALVAASAAFVGCSSDEDLAQVPEIVEEETPVFQGYPMHVSASAGEDTRGTDLDGDSFDAFTMYSNMAKGSTPWDKGVAFTKGTSWSAGTTDVSFPDNTNSYYFYGVSDAANITKTDGKPDISTVGTSFNFTYQIPTAYADQKDLLVGKTTGSGSDGKVNFTDDNKFTHALAKIQAIKVYANTTKLAEKGFTDYAKYSFRINGIRLCGLKKVGTYTFGDETPWAVSGSGDDFEITLKASELTFANMAFTPDAENTKHSLPLNDDGLYLIPQSVTGSIVPDGEGYAVSGAYVELDAQVFVDSDDPENPGSGWYHCCNDNSPMYFNSDNSTDAGFGTIHVPLKIDISAGAGKGYTLVIDLGQGIIMDGMYEATPVFEGISFEV